MDTTISVRPGRNLARIDALRATLRDEGWAALLVLDETDITYLTGLSTSNAALIVLPSSDVLVTDFRYVEAAQGLGLEVRRVAQALYADLGPIIGELAGGGTVAYSPETLTHSQFLQLTENLPGSVTLRSASGVVKRQRAVKDSHEVESIRRAAGLLDQAYAHIVDIGLAGRRENEIVWEIERVLREAGATGMSFPAIVASGPRGARPHHSPDDSVIPNDTLVTIDIGCVVDGYCSDCTRTFATGDLSDELRTIYDVTLQAQEAALAAVKPGAMGVDLDAIARTIITDAGYGEYFGHGLGHGVGMEVHESPTLSSKSNDTLAPGHIVTVEPGIYLPDVGGVRIEDLAVVTEDGHEVLTSWPKDLQQA